MKENGGPAAMVSRVVSPHSGAIVPTPTPPTVLVERKASASSSPLPGFLATATPPNNPPKCAASVDSRENDGAGCGSTTTLSASSFWSFGWDCLWSFLQAFVSVYLPLVWHSFWGGLSLIKYLLLEHMVTGQGSGKADQSMAAWAWASASDPSLASGLTCLALLVCVALAVHPEGFTWLAVRKIRQLFTSLLRSFAACWTWLLNDDTGVMSTLLALATFCSLFFFCYVLHRTLAPKQPPRPKPKSGGDTNVGSSAEPAKASLCWPKTGNAAPTQTSSSARKKKKKKSAAKKRNAASVAAKASSAEPPKTNQSAPAAISLAPPPPEPTTASRAPPKLQLERSGSVSTVDTASSSVFEEDSVFSSRATQPTTTVKVQHQQRNHRSKSQRSSNHSNNNNRGRPNTNNPVASSRWDALKPEVSPASSSATPSPTCCRQQNNPHWKNSSNKNNNKLGTNNHSTTHGTPSRSSCEGNPLPSASPSCVRRIYRAPKSFPRKGSPETVSKATTTPTPLPTPTRVNPLETSHAAPTSPRYSHSQGLLPQTPATVGDSFFSELDPHTPPFAPAAPPPLRTPPGFGSLQEQRVAPLTVPALEPHHNCNTDHGDNTSSFFLPPALSSSLDTSSTNAELLLPESTLPFTLAPTLPPPGLMTPSHPASVGATLPPGCGSPVGVRGRTVVGSLFVPENPFEEEETEAQIEAELQELGGRMIGSILDS